MTQEELDNKWKEILEQFPPEDDCEPNPDQKSFQTFESWVLWKGGKPSPSYFLSDDPTGDQLYDIVAWVESLGFVVLEDPRHTSEDRCDGLIAFPKEPEEKK